MNMKNIQKQRGVSLLIVLLLLLVMTLLGLASLRGTIMGEKSTANLYDRSLSFQATEAALREAETLVNTTAVTAYPANGQPCSNGLCARPLNVGANAWESNVGWRNATTVVGGLTAAPQFIIEPVGYKEKIPFCIELGNPPADCNAPMYRITARSTAANRAQVVLQANYARP
jgi:type IV pilus assembly protein PilX